MRRGEGDYGDFGVEGGSEIGWSGHHCSALHLSGVMLSKTVLRKMGMVLGMERATIPGCTVRE